MWCCLGTILPQIPYKLAKFMWRRGSEDDCGYIWYDILCPSETLGSRHLMKLWRVKKTSLERQYLRISIYRLSVFSKNRVSSVFDRCITEYDFYLVLKTGSINQEKQLLIEDMHGKILYPIINVSSISIV